MKVPNYFIQQCATQELYSYFLYYYIDGFTGIINDLSNDIFLITYFIVTVYRSSVDCTENNTYHKGMFEEKKNHRS